MSSIKSNFEDLKLKAYDVYKKNDKPTKSESIVYFRKCIADSVKLIFKEKEIIVFAILQLVCIGLGYYLWVNILNWIPEEIWDEYKEKDDGSVIDLVFLLWSFFCVGLTAYPLGILTACMGTAHFLHENDGESTVAKCLRIVLSRSWPIWIFSWVDGWWTVMRILERLPKKNDRTPRSTKLINEATYQAWKIASLGVIPSLIIGRSVADCCRDSLAFLRVRFKVICQLRIAYSFICWFFGIASYVGGIFLAPYILSKMSSNNDMYTFYVYVGIPMLIALFFIQVIFRPIYILTVCRIYSNFIREYKVPVVFPSVSKFSSSIIAFLLLGVIIFAVFLYRDELGITQMLSKM